MKKQTNLKKYLLLVLTMLALMLCGCQNSSVSTGTNTDVKSTNQDSVEFQVTEEEVQEDTLNTEQEDPSNADQEDVSNANQLEETQVTEDGSYTSKEEVALYIHEYGHLPQNFISKTKARKAGWDNKEGNLDEVLPGMSIGGSEYKNYDGELPDAPGRSWTECDINYHGGYRQAERIIFSNDGLVYYTNDHYKTFEQLY